MNCIKQIGIVTEFKVMTAFIELGHAVATPYGDCENYDFIVDVNGRLLRIQCKTARQRAGGESISIDCRRPIDKRPYTNIDYFATFYEGVVYLVPAGGPEHSKTLRLAPLRKKAPISKITWAEDYEIEKVLNELEEGRLCQ